MSIANDEHRIRRTRFDVRLTSERSAIGMPARLERYFVQFLEPLLERSLDEYGGAGTVGIDRVEIDLGTINLDRIDSEVVGRIDASIRRALASRSPTVSMVGQPAERLSAQARSDDASIRLPVEQRYLYFLATGRLPWHESESVAALELSLMSMPAGRRSAFLRSVRDALSQAEVRGRIELQASVAFVTWLLSSIEESDVRFPDEFKRQLARKLSEQESASAEVPTSALREAADIEEAGVSSASPDTSGHDRTRTRQRELRVTDEYRFVSGPIDEAASVKSTDADVYYVKGAGVCLLNPFLPELFAATGLTGPDTMFVDESARERGIHLLSFLVNGAEFAEEPDMILYKVVCSWELQKPLRRELRLSQAEKAECGNVLESCIAHWTRLRNTSTAALRKEFLLRDGRLHRENEDWRLIVEQKSIDVLLDSVPWTVARIQLPWCRSLLFVDWR